MNEKLMLARVMAVDPDFAERIIKKTAEVKKDKQNLLERAQTYSEKYAEEVAEGTRRKQLLLSHGSAAGLTEEEVMKNYGKFLPTVRTPILNLLYFMMKEIPEPDWDDIRREFFIKFGHEFDGLNRDELNKKYGNDEWGEEEKETKEPKEMLDYVFEESSITLDIFNKIKKLKALSRSSNENEAFIAYRSFLSLCKKYNLNPDKVPCNIEKES